MKNSRRAFRSISVVTVICMLAGMLGLSPLPSRAAAEGLNDAGAVIANGSFESDLEGWESQYTPIEGATPITIKYGWSPAGGGDKRLNYWSGEAYTADTYQTVSGLENGTYMLSAWITSSGGFNESYMYAKDTGAPEVRTDIPASDSWTQIHGLVTVESHTLTLGFYADGPADKWMEVDLITLEPYVEEPAAGLVNDSFESDLEGWAYRYTPADGASPITIASGWSPAGGGDKRLNYWSADAYTADTYQTVSGLENGTYKLSAWVSSNAGFNESYMYVKDTGKAEVRTNIPASDAWVQIQAIVVVESGTLTVGFYADAPAGKWLGVDFITLLKQEDVELEPAGVNIPNRGFQEESSDGIASWTVSGDEGASFIEAPGYLSSRSLTHYSGSAYETATYQTISGLDNGFYTLTGWVQNGGGQHAAYLFARDNGTSESRTALPIASEWTKVYIRGIEVTNGQATIGIYSNAKAGNWAKLDFVELVKDDQPYRFLKGGDVSELTHVEANGGKFYDQDGNEKDLFLLLKENGHDIVRLRVYNEPGKGHGDGSYYRPAGIMDKEDILKLANRAKAAGLQIQLSFHYSDFWTNGATHMIPNAWQDAISGLATEAEKVNKLEELLYAYTEDVMAAMVNQGTAPEYVSLGNEMQSGILFPFGRASITNWPYLARFLQAGAGAVRDVSPDSKIILHLDDAGNYGKYESFFDEIEARGVDYDIIGPSYYPFWTDLTIEQNVEFCNYISDKYDKDIMIMETGYNWNPVLPDGTIGQLNDNGPYPADTSSPEGQKQFMINLFSALKSVNNGRVIGDLYWDPIMIATPGVGWAIKESDDQPDLNVVSNTTLFDFDGRALPAMDAYKYNAEGTVFGHISGIVRGTGGNGIAGAEVSVTVNGNVRTVLSDAKGNYLIPDLPEGASYTVSAAKNGYAAVVPVTAAVVAGQFTANQHITLTGGAIAGTVEDERGVPVQGAKVSATIGGTVYSAITGGNGSYTIADLPASSNIVVTAGLDGYDSGAVEGVAVGIGSTTNGINLTVVLSSGSISGTVAISGGGMLADALVTVNVAGKAYKALTDSEGRYTIYHVPAGSDYTVTAAKTGYLSGARSGIAVAIGETTSGIAFELQPNAGTIRGVVTDSSGAPVAGAAVKAQRTGGVYDTVTDANGRYTLEHVLGGSGYAVTASKAGYMEGRASSVTVTALTVTDNIDIKLATPIPLVNASFETQGAYRYIIPGWTINGTDYATFTQTHGEAKDGSYVFSHWLGGPYVSDAYQTVTGLEDGEYVLSAWFYNGGEQNEYYWYAEDAEGTVTRLDIPKTSGMTLYSMNVQVTGGKLTIGFFADANAGNWALVDDLKLGYLGPLDTEEPEPTPTATPSPTATATPSPTPEATPAPTADPVSTPKPAPTAKLIKADLQQGKHNEEAKSITIEAAGEFISLTLELSVLQLKQALAEGTHFVIVKSGLASVTFDLTLLNGYLKSGASTVRLDMTEIASGQLSSSAQRAIGNRLAYDFELLIDGEKAEPFAQGLLAIEMPYVLGAGEQPHTVIVYYIADNGELEIVTSGLYDETAGTVRFVPRHLSKYAAAHVTVSFTDLSHAAWAKKSIELLAARAVVNGFEDGSFRPVADVTRGQFVHMLMNLLGRGSGSGASSFTDVKSGMWYSESIAGAAELGIVKGKPDGSFGVSDAISREEMAVMIYRAMQAVEVELPAVQNEGELAAFADAASIADYAKEAVEALQRAGLIQGFNDGLFSPEAHTTRAQAAALLERLFYSLY